MEDTLDVVQLWKDLEDNLIPSLGLSAQERALYYHILRHSRLLGRTELHSTVADLAYHAGFSWSTTRDLLRNLARKGCLRIFSRSKAGHVIGVLLPAEILVEAETPVSLYPVGNETSPKARSFREVVLRRDAQKCFYCRRHLHPDNTDLDHVVPQAEGGETSISNLVACCHDCNLLKGTQPAADFLRSLFRSGRLNTAELDDRLAALEALAQAAPGPQSA